MLEKCTQAWNGYSCGSQFSFRCPREYPKQGSTYFGLANTKNWQVKQYHLPVGYAVHIFNQT